MHNRKLKIPKMVVGILLVVSLAATLNANVNVTNARLVRVGLATVEGSVTSSSTENHVAGARVTMYCGGMYPTDDVTDSSGFYRVRSSDLITGPTIFTLKVEKSGYDTKWEYVTCYPRQIVEKDIRLTPALPHYNYMALLMTGIEEDRFIADTYHMYNTLIDHYSFSGESIYYLANKDKFGDYPFDPKDEGVTWRDISPLRDGESDKATFEWAIGEIAARINPNGHLIVFFSGHGEVDKLFYGSIYSDKYYTPSYLNSQLNKVYCAKKFIFIEACKSGSFLDGSAHIQGPGRAIYTACNSSEDSFGAEIRGISDHNHWFKGLYYGLDPDLAASDADENGNRRVSLAELFVYSPEFLDPPPGESQTPQKWVDPTNLGGTDSNLYIGDGYYS